MPYSSRRINMNTMKCDMSSYNKDREFPVELLRIIACLMVITIHTHLPAMTDDGNYDKCLVLIQCLIGDAVGIFWMIGGCFIFSKHLDYKKSLKKSVKKIVLPMAMISIFMFYFGQLFTGGTLLESMTHSKGDYYAVLRRLILWTNPVEHLDHLWYLYVYLLIQLILPVLNVFVGYLDDHAKAEKWFCVITLVLFAVNDVCVNGTFAFSHHTINAAVPASIEMIYGHIIYKHRKQLRFKFSSFFWALSFSFFMILRWYFQMVLYSHFASDYLLFWYTVPGVICTSSLMLFVYHAFNELADNHIKKVLCRVGKYTFYIYLIHMHIFLLLKTKGLTGWFFKNTVEKFPGYIGKILYTIGVTISVFLASLLVVLIWIFIKRIIFRNRHKVFCTYANRL